MLLKVKIKFKLVIFFFSIFSLYPIPNCHELGLGDIGNWKHQPRLKN